jgi:hypothetical protein
MRALSSEKPSLSFLGTFSVAAGGYSLSKKRGEFKEPSDKLEKSRKDLNFSRNK